jgi:hypothetical protein
LIIILIKFYSRKVSDAAKGTNLCGYYVCEFIHTFTNECRTLDISIIFTTLFYPYKLCWVSFIIFVMMIDKFMREKLLSHQCLLAIQDELAGFLLKEIIDQHEGFNINRRTWSSCNCNDLHVIEVILSMLSNRQALVPVIVISM